MNWQGTWSGATGYAVSDAVAYNGSSYISIQPGTGQEPDTSPTFWSLLAQVGATGATGPTGLSVPQVLLVRPEPAEQREPLVPRELPAQPAPPG